MSRKINLTNSRLRQLYAQLKSLAAKKTNTTTSNSGSTTVTNNEYNELKKLIEQNLAKINASNTEIANLKTQLAKIKSCECSNTNSTESINIKLMNLNGEKYNDLRSACSYRQSSSMEVALEATVINSINIIEYTLYATEKEGVNIETDTPLPLSNVDNYYTFTGKARIMFNDSNQQILVNAILVNNSLEWQITQSTYNISLKDKTLIVNLSK